MLVVKTGSATGAVVRQGKKQGRKERKEMIAFEASFPQVLLKMVVLMVLMPIWEMRS